ncbi:MAG: hypothetical protein IKP96_01300 [Elusimicrobiaceae bacterium]|nr:hypothetical protein [Elusimicrobiaceae bacterium]
MMQRILTFIKKPYTQKGIVLGTLDLLLKAVVLFVWSYLTIVLVRLFVGSLLTDYNPMHKLWWFSYCFIMFFGLSWLSYIVFFVRDYNEEN